ncbi:hypothetical protein [Collimonas fungivorans]|uniref:hypothetical protein n=1 Tax=Collimonas fungivorans TaxID=158899 RepID=UPI003FA3AAF7
MRVKATPEELLRRRRVRQRKHYWRKTHQRLPPSQVAPPFGFRSVTENYWWKGEFSLLEEDFDVDPATLFCNGCIDLHPDAWTNSAPTNSRGQLRMTRGEVDAIKVDRKTSLREKYWPRGKPKSASNGKHLNQPTRQPPDWMLRFWSSTNSPIGGMKPDWWDKLFPGLTPTGGWVPGTAPPADYYVHGEPRYVRHGHHVHTVKPAWWDQLMPGIECPKKN